MFPFQASHLLQSVKRSRDFAMQLMNTTRLIRESLKKNSTQQILKQALKYSQHYPHLMRDWSSNISSYLDTNNSYVKKGMVYNETILHHLNISQERLNQIIDELILDRTGSSKMLKRLSYIDRAAGAWVAILKPLKLDIFYGFPTEDALTKYYLNSSKQEKFNKFVFSGK